MTSNFTETTLVGIKGRFAASGASGAGVPPWWPGSSSKIIKANLL